MPPPSCGSNAARTSALHCLLPQVREPLAKKLEEDPAALDKMVAEVEALQQQLAALDVAK